jgi:precorrin-4/cobalt-precorrin-4 C11-methyltransferase
LFSTIREQIDRLEKEGISCKVVPGISATFGAASSMNLELTLPGITQTLIITRAEFRTPVPEIERISELAKHGSTMIFYLSVHLIKEIVEELLRGGRYSLETPAAVVYRATWKDEKIIKGKLKDIVEKTKKEKILKTALIIIGNVLEPKEYQLSKVYDAEFTHGYRRGKKIINSKDKVS